MSTQMRFFVCAGDEQRGTISHMRVFVLNAELDFARPTTGIRGSADPPIAVFGKLRL